MKKPKITCTASVDSPEERGGSCYADISYELTVGCATYQLSGWRLCGYLPRGAHADLDGSGLEVWGDGQRGGWTCCSGDGQSSGQPYADIDADGDIIVRDGEGGSHNIAALPDGMTAEELAYEINEAIEACADTVPAPDADRVWDELETRENRFASVRVGSPWGAGAVVCVNVDDEKTVYLAGEAWEDAVGKAAIRAVQHELDKLASK